MLTLTPLPPPPSTPRSPRGCCYDSAALSRVLLAACVCAYKRARVCLCVCVCVRARVCRDVGGSNGNVCVHAAAEEAAA